MGCHLNFQHSSNILCINKSLVFDLVILSVELFVSLETAGWYMSSLWVIQIFWIVDIVLSFFSATYFKGELSYNLRVIARVYITSWFPFDLFCTFSSMLVLLFDSNISPGMVRSVKVLRALRYIRVVRMFKSKHILDLFLNQVNSIAVSALVYTVQYLIGLALWVHVHISFGFQR